MRPNNTYLRASSTAWIALLLVGGTVACSSAPGPEAAADEAERPENAGDPVGAEEATETSEALGGFEYYICTPQLFITQVACAGNALCIAQKLVAKENPLECLQDGSECFYAAKDWWDCHKEHYGSKVCKVGNLKNRTIGDDLLCSLKKGKPKPKK